jgi:hypothetical protein
MSNKITGGFTMSLITSEQMQNVLAACYDKAINGIPKVSKGVIPFAEEYKNKFANPKQAANELIKWQVIKCGTSGFVTGFGGWLTMAVALPANITSVLYVQLRMIAAIAYIGGYDPRDDAVQTMAYLCLVGNAVGDTFKQVGIKVGNRLALNALKKLPGKVLTKINQRVGMRLLTKFGTKGAINLVKVVPVAGAVVGLGVDVASTKIIAKQAIKMFIDNPYASAEDNEDAESIEILDIGDEIPEVIEIEDNDLSDS